MLVEEKVAVTVFAPQTGTEPPAAPDGVTVLPPGGLSEQASSFDAIFHHLGNNPWHEFAYRLALEVPDSAAAADRLEAAGAERLAEPVVTPWSDRNVRMQAPDGMQLTLFTVAGP